MHPMATIADVASAIILRCDMIDLLSGEPRTTSAPNRGSVLI
jgi:hypothetical protein